MTKYALCHSSADAQESKGGISGDAPWPLPLHIRALSELLVPRACRAAWVACGLEYVEIWPRTGWMARFRGSVLRGTNGHWGWFAAGRIQRQYEEDFRVRAGCAGARPEADLALWRRGASGRSSPLTRGFCWRRGARGCGVRGRGRHPPVVERPGCGSAGYHPGRCPRELSPLGLKVSSRRAPVSPSEARLGFGPAEATGEFDPGTPARRC